MAIRVFVRLPYSCQHHNAAIWFLNNQLHSLFYGSTLNIFVASKCRQVSVKKKYLSTHYIRLAACRQNTFTNKAIDFVGRYFLELLVVRILNQFKNFISSF